MQFVFLSLALLVKAQSSDEKRVHGVNGWYIPQFNGSFNWMYRTEVFSLLSKYELIERRSTQDKESFHLYTPQNPDIPQHIKIRTESIQKSMFKDSFQTRFVIHGWNQKHTSNGMIQIVKAWLAQGDYNVIVVDWQQARTVNYLASAAAVSKVGKSVGAMIQHLQEFHGLQLNKLIVIGFSLGAHVAGHAGKTVGKGRVRQITGLDPAMPVFNFRSKNGRLSIDDASYVEIIHTNGGFLGFKEPLGHADYYPNGGSSQPSCDRICSHRSAILYYAEAVGFNCFAALLCKDLKSALQKNCSDRPSAVRMGYLAKGLDDSSIFYVPIKKERPYGVLCNEQNKVQRMNKQ